MLGAELPDSGEVALVGHHHPGLPLDGLHHEGRHVGVLKSFLVVVVVVVVVVGVGGVGETGRQREREPASQGVSSVTKVRGMLAADATAAKDQLDRVC